MDRESWTPNQREIVHRLLGRDDQLRPLEAFPEFPEDLAFRLQTEIEGDLETVARALALPKLVIGKHHLTTVFKCEGLLLAEEEFEWTTQKAKGTLVQKAIQATVTSRGAALPPMELVEQAVSRVVEDDADLGRFIRGLSVVELGVFETECADLVTKYLSDFPLIRAAWIPRVESRIVVPLCGGKIELRGKYDLALGRPGVTPAEVTIIDFKTGAEWYEHREEMRYYALLETLRNKVPPRKVATHYLDGGWFRDEEVTEDVLASAARRVVEGVNRISSLWSRAREPDLSAGPHCRYCPALEGCPTGQDWTRIHSTTAQRQEVEY